MHVTMGRKKATRTGSLDYAMTKHYIGVGSLVLKKSASSDEVIFGSFPMRDVSIRFVLTGLYYIYLDILLAVFEF